MITYQVFITPRNGRMTYGEEIEVTRFVLESGISQIRRGIDSTDYSFGSFFFDDVQVKFENVNGYFNDENDYRSIFPFGRDKALFRIVYTQDDDETITFEGMIADEATRLDATKDEIQVRALSKYSVFKDIKVSGGSIADGSLASSAFFSILNQPEITEILNIDALNINPANDITIDNGSTLENKTVNDSLNRLLLATNSVMVVEDDDVIIKSRDETAETSVLELYGPFDLKRRENILDLKNYNTGKQRMFNAVSVNGNEELASGHVDYFGYRKKELTMDFLTDEGTERSVAAALVDEFKTPKVEVEVTVTTKTARSVKPLDRVSINHPLRIVPVEGEFLPVIGDAVIGDVVTPLPITVGSIRIEPQMAFKVLEIKEDPKTFQTTLKLRQIGVDIGDGYFTSSPCAIIGYSTIGFSEICGEGDPADTYNPSVVGAAIVGYTEVEG